MNNNDPLKNSFKTGFKFAAGAILAQTVIGLTFLAIIGIVIVLVANN